MHPRLTLLHALTATCGLFLTTAFADDAPPRHLFVLSGQSNMTQDLSDSFRNCVEQALGKERVIVTRTGRPSQSIKAWDKDWKPPAGMEDANPETNGKLYDEMLRNVRGAIGERPPASVTFIWMQGEADAESGWAASYEKSFLSLLERIKSDLGMDEIHFVVGRINDFWLEKQDGKALRDILAKLGDEHANGAWIDTDDLNRGVNPWGGFSFEDGHFPPAGYVVMGQRLARQACLLLDPNLKSAPAIFAEHFIDSHEQIKSHGAMGKEATAHPAIPGFDTRKSLLTDGKFGPADHKDTAWLAVPPAEQPVEFVIDLGVPMIVDEIGVNMLLSSEAKAEFPTRLIYSTSEDGETFTVNHDRYNTIHFYNKRMLQEMRAEGIAPQSILLLTRQRGRFGREPVNARKIKISIETGDQWVFIDEIVVNPRK
jgi:hypothetical protein